MPDDDERLTHDLEMEIDQAITGMVDHRIDHAYHEYLDSVVADVRMGEKTGRTRGMIEDDGDEDEEAEGW